MIKGSGSSIHGKIFGQEHIKQLEHLNFLTITCMTPIAIASNMKTSDRAAFYSRKTNILLFVSAIKVFLGVFGDLKNECYVCNNNIDLIVVHYHHQTQLIHHYPCL